MSTVATKQVKELLRKWEEALASNEPTVLTSDSGQQSVVMSLELFLSMSKEDFSAWQETIYLLSNPANAKHLLEAIARHKAGLAEEHDLIDP